MVIVKAILPKIVTWLRHNCHSPVIFLFAFGEL